MANNLAEIYITERSIKELEINIQETEELYNKMQKFKAGYDARNGYLE